MSTRPCALPLALGVAAAHGVTCGGACALEALSHRLANRHAAALPQTGAVLVLLLPFYTGEYPNRNVACYAVPDDYHRIAGDILQEVVATLAAAYPQNCFLPFVDSSPIPEVEAAVLAGLGWRGKNGQLLTEGYGSLCFLCEVVTDLALWEVVDQPPKSVPDSCGSCTRCLDSCPTGALSLNGLDKTRCRSFITQKKGTLSDWERDQIQAGGLAWGCDICTMACPRNRRPVLSTVAALREHPVPRLTAETVAPLLSQKSYGWRGSGVLLRNLAILNDSERE